MKQLLFLLVLSLIVFSSCQNNAPLTEEEKQTIETEVTQAYENLSKAINNLDFEAWSKSFNKDQFVSLIKGSSEWHLTLDAWMDSVENSFSKRGRHQSQMLDLNVTVLDRNHALLTTDAIWENWFENGKYAKLHGYNSFVWLKDENGWKVIHKHTSNKLLESKQVQ